LAPTTAIDAGAKVILLSTLQNAPFAPLEKGVRYIVYGDCTSTQLATNYGGKTLGAAIDVAWRGHVAIDGKRLRGSAAAQSPGTHLLAAFSDRLQGVIGQLRVAPEANEITAALELLKILPLKGVTITGDAIFTQRAICQTIIDGDGNYFFTVKGNQPALKADIEQAFRPFSPLGGMVGTA